MDLLAVTDRAGRPIHGEARVRSQRLTQIFLCKNAANLLTSAPTKCFHHSLGPSLIMGVKEWSRGENKLDGLSFIDLAQHVRNGHKLLEGTVKSSRFRAARSVVVLSLLSVADRAHRGEKPAPCFCRRD
jgi:hypothetical protein